MTRSQAAAQGATQGGLLGAQTGNPYGVAIGAGIGGLMGYLGAAQQEENDAKAHKKQEEFNRLKNKYAAFWDESPIVQHARPKKSVVPALMSGVTEGAYTGGMIADIYKKKSAPPVRIPTGDQRLPMFDQYSGNPIEYTV